MEESPFYRDTWARVNLGAIYENVTCIKSIIPKGEGISYSGTLSNGKRRMDCYAACWI